MDDLERQYLSAAYEVAMKNPRHAFYQDEIAADFDLDYGPNSDEDLLANIASDLVGRGYIEIDKQNQNLGRVALRLTTAGKEEAERLANPVEQRKEQRRRFLRAVYELAAGSPSQFVYWPGVAARLGRDAENRDHLEEALGYADYLASLGLITVEVEEGLIYRITAAGIDKVEQEGARSTPAPPPSTHEELDDVARPEEAPLHIWESLPRFREDYPDPATVAFIVMQFRDTKAHKQIARAIKEGLAAHGITGVRADDKEYHEDLFPNIVTYMHGCGMGVVVFESIEAKDFNPNVSLEVGYMYAIGKKLCLLKDRTLTALHSDLTGKLYREFDSDDPEGTLPSQLSQWLKDSGLSQR